MNKKLISALFVGALLLGSTSALTSCKDYDDDINSLQSQIDKAALQSSVDALKTDLASATATASAAKTTAESALAKAQAANDAVATKAAQADLTAAVARITALETAMKDVQAFEAQLKAASDSAIADMTTKFNALKTEVYNAIGNMITSVSLVGSFTGLDPDNGITLDYKKAINIENTSEKENVFGKGLTGELTFTKDKLVTFADGILIRVSPSNADLTKDAVIRLIRSNGNIDVNNMLAVDGTPSRYDGDIVVTRATDNTGLWIVKFKLTDAYKAADFAALTKVEPTNLNSKQYYGFGLQINNTTNTETRYVPSEFDIALKQTAMTNAAALEFTVDGKSIADLKNRYDACEDGTSTSKVDEQIWNSSTPAVAAITKDKDATNFNVNQKWNSKLSTPAGVNDQAVNAADNRQTKAWTPAEVNKDITIKITNPSVKAFYVALDKDYALESNPSEINAWNAYNIDNLNVVQMGNKGTIKITSTTANGDKIGFRVYAVNYNGTLIDPDGRAFYVAVGAQAKTDAITGTITVGKPGPASQVFALNTKFASSATMTEMVMSDKNPKYGADASTTANQVSPAFTYTLWKAADTSVPGNQVTNWADAKYIKVIMADPTQYIDGATYNATISIMGDYNILLNYVTLTITKALPTKFPNTFTWKEGQLVNDVFTCYAQPSTSPVNWSYTEGESATGYQDMKNVCNGLTDTAYEFLFKNAQYKGGVKANGIEDYKLASPYVLAINKDFIDNADHSTEIYYNYGKVKTYLKADGTWSTGTEDHKILGQTVTTKFACELGTTTQTYAWVQEPAVKDGNGNITTPAQDMNYVTYGQTSYIAAKYLKGTNAYDNTTFGLTFDNLFGFYKGLDNTNATLTSVGSGVADYFTVTFESAAPGTPARFVFTPKSNTTPFNTSTVASKLNLKLTDRFGHVNTYSLDVTVKK